jgi:hypothetical protein
MIASESVTMASEAGLTRREFVKLAAATSIAIGAGSLAGAAEKQGGMPYRTLGRTGEQVSAIGLGGYHIGKLADEQESIRLIRGGIDGGITFMDNCWDYNGGASEVRMGTALRDGYRDKVFLMTKIDGRTKEAAALQINDPWCGFRPITSIYCSSTKSSGWKILIAFSMKEEPWKRCRLPDKPARFGTSDLPGIKIR